MDAGEYCLSMRNVLIPVALSGLLLACGSGEEEAQVADNQPAKGNENAAEGDSPKSSGGADGEPAPVTGGESAQPENKSNLKTLPSRPRRNRPVSPPKKPEPPSPVVAENNETNTPPVLGLDSNKDDNKTSDKTTADSTTPKPDASTLVPKTSATAADLVGSWTKQAGGYEYKIDYAAGGSGTVIISHGNSSIKRLITWKVDGAKYSQTGKDEETGKPDTVEGTFAIKDEELTLTLDGEANVLKRVRQ